METKMETKTTIDKIETQAQQGSDKQELHDAMIKVSLRMSAVAVAAASMLTRLSEPTTMVLAVLITQLDTALENTGDVSKWMQEYQYIYSDAPDPEVRAVVMQSLEDLNTEYVKLRKLLGLP